MAGAYSNVVTLNLPVSVPAPVLTAAPFNPQNQHFDLSWTSSAAGVTAFELYRGMDGEAPTLYQTLGPTVFHYTDVLSTGPVDVGSSYRYYLIAVTTPGPSGPSNEIEVTIDAGV